FAGQFSFDSTARRLHDQSENPTGAPMWTRIRMPVGVIILVFGLSSFVFFVLVFSRVGLPQAQETAKATVYAWVLTISIPLPITTGVALLRGTRSWRPFVGWWLLVAGVLALGSLLWFLPAYQGWPLSFVVG